MNKYRIGVSACLLGQPVRYDGAAKPVAFVRDELPRWAELIPFCPETGAGLGVPRPQVQLVEQAGRLHALGVNDASLDVTTELLGWCHQQERFLDSLDALIVKSRSPSCGLGSAPVAGASRLADGLFCNYVKSHYPHLRLFDETDQDAIRQWLFS